MFGSKSKNNSTAENDPAHREIRHRTGSLIAVANRAEAASLKGGEPTITNSGEVIMARDLFAAHQELLASLRTALLRGSSAEEIRKQIFDPVMEASVVGDVAWLMMQNVISQVRDSEKPIRN